MRLLVSHDAGGAEILSSWLLREGGADVACVLDGPARRVFERKLGNRYAEVSLAEGLARADELLCGTSWQSTLELDAIAAARAHGLRTIAWLDHWVNYRERFEHEGRAVLPDELWVGDEFALARAREIFPQLPVTLAGNPYFDDIRAEAKRLPVRPAGGPATVLYVSEPVSQHGHMSADTARVGYDEHEALRYFLSKLPALGVAVERVLLRPHPSEPPEKYDWALGSEGVRVQRGGGRPLMEEIGESDIVAGMESMAMVIGLLAGKRVVCCIPPGGRPCALPFPQIEKVGSDS